MNPVGADVVEVSPPFDSGGITSLAGATIMYEILCVLAESLAGTERGGGLKPVFVLRPIVRNERERRPQHQFILIIENFVREPSEINAGLCSPVFSATPSRSAD